MNKRTLFAAALCVLLAPPAFAQSDYPNRPVKLVVGFPPGSSGDLLSRAVTARLSQTMGQQMVVETRPGASSSIAAEAAARAPKDGYTLFLGTVANVVNAAITPNLSFDFAKDFAPIGLAATVPVMLATNSDRAVSWCVFACEGMISTAGMRRSRSKNSGPRMNPPCLGFSFT